jgi:uncharacterized membrane protein YdjX (TVP38/TMEM64 family)
MNPRALRTGLVVLLTVGIGLVWWCRDTLTTEAIVAWVEGLGVWGPLVFMGIYGLAPALFVPGAVLTLAGGALFGPLTGALLSLLGATVGATVAFLLARYVAADWVEQRLGRRLQEVKAGVERQGWHFVAFVRLVPVFPFNLFNYALGLTSLSVRTFAVTSFFTMAPGALVYAYLGYAGREAISGGSDLVRKAFLALTLLAALALLPAFIRRWQRRRGYSRALYTGSSLRQPTASTALSRYMYWLPFADQGREDGGGAGREVAGCPLDGSASGKRRT